MKRDRVGDWQVALALDVPDVEVSHPNPGSAAGADRGVNVLAATSHGELFDREMLGAAGLGPDLLTDGERRRLQRLENRKARQQLGSKRLARTRRQIAKLKRTQARRRKDLAHKVSHHLAETYKTVRAGGTLVEVDPRNTSITCHVCQVVDKVSRENQAECVCTACAHVCHADVNATINILRRAVPTAQPCQGPDGGQPSAACGAWALAGAAKHEPARRPRARQAA